MLNERILLKYPLEFKDICFIYPPTYGDIVRRGYDGYNEMLNTLIISQEDLDDMFAAPELKGEKTPTPFEFLILKCACTSEYSEMVQRAFKLFTHLEILILYDSQEIVIGDLKDRKMIDKDNFFEFQNMIREVNGIPPQEAPDPDEDPRIRQIKAKGRMRERVKAKQHKRLELSSQILILCNCNVGVTLDNIAELPYAAGTALLQMCQQKEKYNIDLQCICHGASAEQIKPRYWMDNFEET